jgi:hypothetical protein
MYSIPDRGLERGGACLDCELVESLLSSVFEYALVAAVHDGQHLHSRRKKSKTYQLHSYVQWSGSSPMLLLYSAHFYVAFGVY